MDGFPSSSLSPHGENCVTENSASQHPTEKIAEYHRYVKLQDPLFNDWARLSSEDARAAKLYYSNLAHDLAAKPSEERLNYQEERLYSEQMEGWAEHSIEHAHLVANTRRDEELAQPAEE